MEDFFGWVYAQPDFYQILTYLVIAWVLVALMLLAPRQASGWLIAILTLVILGIFLSPESSKALMTLAGINALLLAGLSRQKFRSWRKT